MRRLALPLAALVLLLALAAPAGARRPPTVAENKAIRTAMTAFIRKGDPAAKDNRVIRVVVSTVSPQWALTTQNSPTVGRSSALLHRGPSAWKVVTFGTGGFRCSIAPRKVLRDLDFGCIP
jgi:hypothetical protein